MDFKIDKEVKLPSEIFDARFHPSSESNLVAAATIAGDVHILEDGNLKSKIRKHHKGSSIRRVRFFNDGRLVTIAKTVKIHDLTTNQTTHTLKRDDGKQSVFYSVKPFGANIVSVGDDDGGVFVWDTRTPETPIFSSYDCDQYISDIDGKFENRRMMFCTSGEGTLTVYDLRAKKMVEPQSELFEAGFQCVKYVDTLKKIVIGGEDGAIYVFNNNEWAHTSGKFAISSDLQNRGKCSIDCLDSLPNQSTFLAGCSDGRVRVVTLWPHQIIAETMPCKKNSIESIHVSPIQGCNQVLVSGGKYLNYIGFEEKSDDDEEESDEEPSLSQADNSSSAVSTTNIDPLGEQDNSAPVENKSKKFKSRDKKSDDEDGDYLNVFK